MKKRIYSFILVGVLVSGMSQVIAQETECEECEGEAAFMFEAETSQVKKGTPESEITQWLGKPMKKYNSEYTKYYVGVKADYSYHYSHPEYATYWWVVAFKNKKVVGHQACQEVGSRTVRTECKPTKVLWQEINGN